jgi:hypothetical protein
VYGVSGEKVKCVTSGPGYSCLTAMACVSVSGDSLPPLIIFQGKHLYNTWKGMDPSIDPKTTILKMDGLMEKFSVDGCNFSRKL